MAPTFFAKQSDFRNWLKKNHKKESELIVGFYKVGSGHPSMSWSQSVDEALCFGWIDGVRTSIDKDSYQIRFTQRKPSSIWSAINIKKIETLTKQGLMQPAGLASFDKRKEANSKIYAHESEAVKFTPAFEKQFKANKKAWHYFQSLAASYKKISTHWVMSAKQEATQLKRLYEIITDSEAGTNKWKDNKYKKK
ncbi:YdeI/OmpD-associated family protein [Ferruginibacter sp. SUN106]|uniref:YdeI/OmpD-associated family protein n=1 Tax=Ferruginibacter sp. SUN106 TaxID=2978348 RepID=UPI003D36210E